MSEQDWIKMFRRLKKPYKAFIERCWDDFVEENWNDYFDVDGDAFSFKEFIQKRIDEDVWKDS